ncbi:Glycosyltransferase involved in cell wall bisynthesis [Pseudobutyrivibrio sp. AR14]|uniref:Glycosyltransferase n=1 Tax=Pseudobutyrivibrio ruminis TaxID=46206 RepID=A0A2G3EB65_9FIRM|nr:MULTISPECIES: glycosyltransferase family 2 protein [Pseudobutyrivibrio]MBR5953189.1 glycosyltransferase family 2 protein [Pseudobutyrivibrio sp.]PHU40363.1 glycosyltransferase [Pseudobutyrivibrio ruminis]SCY26808.1 Glycosyltransferase involved in cell wall bisynthesis [Pseudobutyrivibrio sp. AR14]
MKKLSIVVPCYNEQEAAPIFYDTVHGMEDKLSSVELEFIFVDDGSKDGTLDVLRGLHAKDERVHYVSFSRNFGKEAGIYAGLEKSTGDYVVIMDVDLQDPPAMLPEMLSYIESGEYERVATRRVDRKGEPPIRSWFARKFYKLMNKISSADIVDGARDYQMMTRKVVDAILAMGEYNRFSKGIFGWVGFKSKWLEFENVERVAGETKWSFWKLFIYAIDGIVAFSTAPLIMASVFGVIMCLVAFIFILVIIVKTLILGDPTSGWPSMVCIILLVSGIQLLCMGVLGQYMAKTYLETKKRPIYLVQEEE